MLTLVTPRFRLWLGTVLGIGLALCLSVGPGYSDNRKHSITLEIPPTATYDQALALARQQALAAAESVFQEDTALSRITIEAIGQRGRTRAPLMLVGIARSQWLQNPNPSSLSTEIYAESERLLFPSASNTSISVAPKPDNAVKIVTPETGDATAPEPSLPPLGPIAALAPSPRELGRWKYDEEVGDFFSQVNDATTFLSGAETLEGSYIRFVAFPVRVFIQKDNELWYEAIERAVEDWSNYIPLKLVRRVEDADISIFYEENIASDPGNANLRTGGEARPNLYADPQGNLGYRVNVAIAGYQTLRQISTVARHEIGHALGLWGHSPIGSDLMSAVGRARRGGAYAEISPHTLNTLKRIYEQPTPIGQSAAAINF